MERCSLDSSSRAGPSKTPRKTCSRSQSLAALQDVTPQPKQPYKIPEAPPPVLRKIPRPPNAFILYRSNKMRELMKESQSQTGTGLSKLDYQRQLSKRIGELWRNEDPDVKAAFYDKSQQAAREHAERYPEYRYKPKPLSKKAQKEEALPSGVQETTPERRGDTDFAPGNLSGPISGTGSGSGRKRASLEGARASASPYSAASRHRRTSSSGPTSPSIRQASNNHAGQTMPVLLYSASDARPYHNGTAPMQRSVSQRYTHERKAKIAARRSLDGQMARASSSIDGFDTLVPQYLRDLSHVFLAPAALPPLPIGQAITTDDTASRGDETQQPRPHKPKLSLGQAVKQALPPERRALLQASLIKKGLVPTSETHQDQRQEVPEPVETIANQTQSGWHSAFEQSSSQSSFLPTQESATTFNSTQTTYSDSQHYAHPQLSSDLDPANQASLNINMSQIQAERYGGLADWTQPDPCWLDTSFSQATDGSHSSAAQPLTQSDYSGLEQTQNGCATAHFGTLDNFTTFEMGQYAHPSLDFPVTTANSAIVALSDPNDAGQIQGHFYGLNGEFIAQGITAGFQIGQREVASYVEEEQRQQRAVEELLLQMLQAPAHADGGSGGAAESAYSVYPDYNLPIQQEQAQGPSLQWQQHWHPRVYAQPQVDTQQSVRPTNETVTYTDYIQQQPSYDDIEPTVSPSQIFGDSQNWIETQQSGRLALSDPTGANLNFSRPLGHVVPSQQPGEQHVGSGEGAEPFGHCLSLVTAGLVNPHSLHEALPQEEQEAERTELREEEAEAQCKATKGLRSWKTHQLSSIKEKLAKIKYRNPQSNAQAAQGEGEDGLRVKRER
ncbi:related to HMG-box protein Hmg3 [Ustilago sp. UG-2017b]|nr:related to HMG-box protein Hmg3 [Ustilago sp. UG-2017b]